MALSPTTTLSPDNFKAALEQGKANAEAAERDRQARHATLSPEQARAAAQREQRETEANEAYKQGAWAVQSVLIDIHPDANTAEVDLALMDMISTKNPYKMVSYADEGHQRPAWFRGFNARLLAHYGIGTDSDLKPGDAEMVKNARYGSSPDQKGTRIRSLAEAAGVAKFLTEAHDRAGLRQVFWPEDRGSNVSPRYAVIRGFVIGEPVSYGFNGDSYIAGRVTHMSKPVALVTGLTEKQDPSLNVGPRIITVTSAVGNVRKFYRRRFTGSWVEAQTWSLQHGWHNDRNPSF